MSDRIPWVKLELEDAIYRAEEAIKTRDLAAAKGLSAEMLIWHAKAVGRTVTAAALAVLYDEMVRSDPGKNPLGPLRSPDDL